MRPLIFLEASDIGARHGAEAAATLGYEPVFFCDLGAYEADPLAQITSWPHRQVDTTSLEAVLAHARSLPGLNQGAIATLADSRLVLACEAAQGLGIPGPDPAVVALKSKSAVARLVPEASPPTVAFRRGNAPRAELERLLHQTGRLIVKPDAGSGAAGVFHIHDLEGLAHLDRASGGPPLPHHVDTGDWLAQPFLPGELVSLEGYVARGEVSTMGFTDRRKIGGTESEATFPADDDLRPASRARAEAVTRELLARSGFQNGYFHVEFLVDGESVALIDANVGRLGGGPVAELLAFAYDVEPAAVYRHFLEVTLLHDATRSRPYAAPVRHRAAAVLYGLADGGTLVGVDVPQGTRTRHTQILGDGAQVTPMGTDDWSWVGILTGLEADTRRACESLRVRTRRGLEKPCY